MELEERLTTLQEETLVWEAVLQEERATLQVLLITCYWIIVKRPLCTFEYPAINVC